jgi:transcriptional regulator with XRE-family HTH domain
VTGPGNEAFVRHRIAQGWTQEALLREYRAAAERLGVSGALTVRTLARWESADPPLPRPAAQQVLESLFGVPLEQLGFTVPDTRRTPAVQRRRFLEDSVGAAVALAAPAFVGDHAGRVDAGHLRAIDAAIEKVYVTDHAAGSGSARQGALDLVGRITGLLSNGSYLETVGRALQAALGQVTAHLAWLGYDGGRPDQARTYCLEALHLARMTGNRQLETRALANLSLIALGQGRDWEARSAVEATWSAAHGWANPTVRAMLAVREAGARSGTGDTAGGRRALSQAMSNYDRGADADLTPRWARFFGQGELNQATASYYLAAGRPAAAVPFLKATLGDLGEGYTRNSAAYRAKLALALLTAGEVDAACSEADAVCRWLEQVDSGKIHARLRQFRVLAAASGSRTVTDTVARIDHALKETTP